MALTGVWGADAPRLTTAILYAAIASGVPIAIVFIHNIGECQSLVGTMGGYYLPLPCR